MRTGGARARTVTVFLAHRLFGYGLCHTPASAATSLTRAEPAVAAALGVTGLGPGLVLLTVPVGAGRRGR